MKFDTYRANTGTVILVYLSLMRAIWGHWCCCTCRRHNHNSNLSATFDNLIEYLKTKASTNFHIGTYIHHDLRVTCLHAWSMSHGT